MITLLGLLIGVGEKKDWIHWIEWQHPVSSPLVMPTILITAGVVAILLPITYLVLKSSDAVGKKVLPPILVLLLFQVTSEALFSKLIPSLNLVIAPIYVSVRLCQIYGAWVLAKDAWLKALVGLNGVVWVGILIHLVFGRLPLVLL